MALAPALKHCALKRFFMDHSCGGKLQLSRVVIRGFSNGYHGKSEDASWDMKL
jgi:hypothetical protein